MTALRHALLQISSWMIAVVFIFQMTNPVLAQPPTTKKDESPTTTIEFRILDSAFFLTVERVDVQEELDLSDMQIEEIKKIKHSAVKAQMRRPIATGEPREVEIKEYTGFLKESYREACYSLEKVLLPFQLKRARELNLQERMNYQFGTVLHPLVAKHMNYTDTQLDALKRRVPQEYQAAQREARASVDKAMRGLLRAMTESQRRKWHECLGPPFEQQPGVVNEDGTLIGFFERPDVLGELKLSDAQSEKVRKLLRTAKEKLAAAFAEENVFFLAKRTGIADRLVRQPIAEILSAEQFTRATQIELQLRVGYYLNTPFRPEMIEKLGMTPLETENLNKQMLVELQIMRKETATRRRQAIDNVISEFNDDQRKTWHMLVGVPFEFKY